MMHFNGLRRAKVVGRPKSKILELLSKMSSCLAFQVLVIKVDKQAYPALRSQKIYLQHSGLRQKGHSPKERAVEESLVVDRFLWHPCPLFPRYTSTQTFAWRILELSIP